jgi:hypothetical protein
VPLDVGVHVGDDDVVGEAETSQGRIRRTRPQRRPVAVAAQAEQQVVATCGHVEDEAGQSLGRRAGQPVGLDELGQAGHDVGRVVQHRLFRMQREVGEQHLTHRHRCASRSR